jgi:hypothetical protein
MNAKLLAELYHPQASPLTLPHDEIPEAVPADELPPEVDERSLLGIIELLLKHPRRVDELARDESRLTDLVPSFTLIVLVSFSTFALALVLLLNLMPNYALPPFLRDKWTRDLGPIVSLWAAYTFGLVAASGVCLPSFYFFGLLAGVKISLLQVTGHIMKGKASTAIMLLGILPIYVAVVLGMIVFHAPSDELSLVLYLGLALPFVAGVWGAWSIYRGFLTMADTLPACRRERRTCFLRRLTVAWAACYSVVTPVMIWTLWNYFVARLG